MVVLLTGVVSTCVVVHGVDVDGCGCLLVVVDNFSNGADVDCCGCLVVVMGHGVVDAKGGAALVTLSKKQCRELCKNPFSHITLFLNTYLKHIEKVPFEQKLVYSNPLEQQQA